MAGPSPYRGELLALRVRLEHAAWVLTNETRPRAFEAEMLAPAAQKPRLREMGRELEAMADRLSEGLNSLVLGLVAEEEVGSLG